MTRDQILDLARQTWHHPVDVIRFPEIEKSLLDFATLVAAAEREECAKVCEDQGGTRDKHGYLTSRSLSYHDCAAAIRSRGEKEK